MSNRKETGTTTRSTCTARRVLGSLYSAGGKLRFLFDGKGLAMRMRNSLDAARTKLRLIFFYIPARVAFEKGKAGVGRDVLGVANIETLAHSFNPRPKSRYRLEQAFDTQLQYPARGINEKN